LFLAAQGLAFAAQGLFLAAQGLFWTEVATLLEVWLLAVSGFEQLITAPRLRSETIARREKYRIFMG
jgi:hypothetical protein